MPAKIINPFIEFQGIRYYRDGQGWRASPCKGHERLAPAVWKHHNGPIPRGMVVACIDGDKWNNDIGNLELRGLAKNLVRDAPRWPRERLEQVKAMLDAGLSQVAIAKAMGSKQGTISHKVKQIRNGALNKPVN